jgi:hypothetical protein
LKALVDGETSAFRLKATYALLDRQLSKAQGSMETHRFQFLIV